MIEFVCIYWQLRDRWTVVFANGAQLIGDQLRTLDDAEAAAFETLGIEKPSEKQIEINFQVTRADVNLIRYRSRFHGIQVRPLDDDERARVRDCLEWLHFEGVREGEKNDPDDAAVAARYQARIDQARERWPDVARLIGF